MAALSLRWTREHRVGREQKKMYKVGRSKGQSIIEFALLLPLILIVVGGVTDLALAFFVSQVVQNSVREGARIAATRNPLEPDQVEAEVQSRIDEGLGPSISPFFTLNGPPSVEGPSGICPDQVVKVSVSGTHQFWFLRLINVFIDAFPNSITISRSTTMRWMRQPLSEAACPPPP